MRIIILTITVCVLLGCTQWESIPSTVSEEKIAEIYETIKTPYKYGLILVPDNNSYSIDCPTIFRKDNKWIMVYIIFDGQGYETHLADSNDLIHWNLRGTIMHFSNTPDWDASQKAGYPALINNEWGGDYNIKSFDGNYWMSYLGGDSHGYEAGLLSVGISYTSENPASVHEWKRLNKPVLTSIDSDARWFDNCVFYKSFIMEDKVRLTGHPFVMYFNAKGDSINPCLGAERIGMAVSDDMIHWKRFGTEPVINHHAGISGDAVIHKIGDVYVMFYFGAFWPDKKVSAYDNFACSYDLINWTEWTGELLIQPTETFDALYAHKPCVIYSDGIVYHFYNAVDKSGNRGIALATSKDIGKSQITFNSIE
jgi:predicted GH43/DUF377 family glycosyl hydrolase